MKFRNSCCGNLQQRKPGEKQTVELDESTGDFRNGSCFRHRTMNFTRTGGSDTAPSGRAQQALSTASQPVFLVFLTYPNPPKPLILSSSEYDLPSS